MKSTSHTLGIDFGSQNIGIALIRHSNEQPNEVRYAGTLIVNPSLLSSRVNDRITARRTRRIQKTKKRRLRLLRKALQGLGIGEDAINSIAAFSRRRGYSWTREETEEEREQQEQEYFDFSISREDFFSALKCELERLLPADKQDEVYACCRNMLSGEIRPPRFMNRNPSKCWWDNCSRNVPSARNAVEMRLRQSLFVKFLPLIDLMTDDKAKQDAFKNTLGEYISHFNGLAGKYRSAQLIDDEDQRKNEVKSVNEGYKKKKADFKKYLLSVAKSLGKEHSDNLKANFNAYYGKEIDNLVKKAQSGRVSFCREHSDAYVRYMLDHKEIPYKQVISDSNIISRQQQILFSKLWRFIEARLLPLASGSIDTVVVERAAFDLLASPFRDKITLSEARSNKLYWYGPKYGYSNTVKMLYNEFDGHCTYCGRRFQSNEVSEVEHILPRARFGYNNYFNLTLSCRDCNKVKGERTAYEAGLTVHDDAYNAYSEYVRRRGNLRHHFHTMKKGILNLMRRKNMKAETVLSVIGQGLLEKTYTTRGPRPLARYLSGKLQSRTGKAPAIKYVAGRHTTVYRDIIFPDFDKLADKLMAAKEDSVNHALDACVLAYKMPSVTELERGRYAYREFSYWADRVKSLAPKTDAAGLPAFNAPRAIQDFEKPSSTNPSFYTVDLLSTVWNKKDSATTKQNPYGMTRDGMPVKKKSGAMVVQEILERKDRAKLMNYLDTISHRLLRERLLKAVGSAPYDNVHVAAAQELLGWLKKSVTGSLKNNTFSSHPSSLARKKHLEAFIRADNSVVVEAPERYIPPNISIRMLDLGVRGKTDVQRMDKRTGRILHHYMCQPAIKMKIVAYKSSANGDVNRQKPFVFDVKQNWQVLKDNGDSIAEKGNVLNGRILANGIKEKDYLKDWDAELKKYLGQSFAEWHLLHQGCCLEYADGGSRFIRNFDKTEGFKKELLKGIRRVYKSPYQSVPSS